jgi:predicted CopG family antitoxin
MVSKTIKISEENYIWLLQLAAELQKKYQKQITFDNTLNVLKNGRLGENKLSDLAGSWNLSDNEVKTLKKRLRKSWKWKMPFV